MRTNIDIDDSLMSEVLSKGPYKTKKEAVEAGLRLIARQALARELLKLEGRLDWGWDKEERLDGKSNWSAALADPGTAAKSARGSEPILKPDVGPIVKTGVKARRVNR